MGYLSDYITANAGNHCPPSFWMWSAMNLLGHVAGKKVWFNYGQFPISPATYVGLIGSAGSGKSTAKSKVKNMIVKHFPTLLYSASIQSREDIINLMADPACERGWMNDETGKVELFRPFYIIANEFKNFLSVDPINMVAFLEDVYDENYFSTGFKKDRAEGKAQSFENPFVSMLACGVPDWLMRELKVNMFTGGLGRRLILVVDEPDKPTPWPTSPATAAAAEARVLAHLQEVYSLKGEIKPTPDAKAWFIDWFEKHWHNKPSDPVLSQFHSTKHIQVIKIAMGFCLDERPFDMQLRTEHFQAAVAAFDGLMPKVMQLTSGIGRNENAGYAVHVTEFIRSAGGYMAEKKLSGLAYRHSPHGTRDYDEVIKFLTDTEVIGVRDMAIDKTIRRIVWLQELFTLVSETSGGVVSERLMKKADYAAYMKAKEPPPPETPGSSPV